VCRCPPEMSFHFAFAWLQVLSNVGFKDPRIGCKHWSDETTPSESYGTKERARAGPGGPLQWSGAVSGVKGVATWQAGDPARQGTLANSASTMSRQLNTRYRTQAAAASRETCSKLLRDTGRMLDEEYIWCLWKRSVVQGLQEMRELPAGLLTWPGLFMCYMED
jgi:hypothetical protein